jgi:olefin beta-lactone synthetase
MNVLEYLEKIVQKTPDQPAIIDADGQSISYRDLQKSVAETGAYFSKKGIRAANRVLVFVPMSAELYGCVLGIWQIGATAVFLDEWSSFKRLEICCRVADCTGFLAGWKGRILGIFSSEIRNIPIWLWPKKVPISENFIEKNDAATALITFTTGSTGTPKAANRSHRILDAQFRALLPVIRPESGEITMTTLPIVLLCGLAAGCVCVLPKFNPRKPASFSPADVWAQMLDFQVETFISSPFFVKKLAEWRILNPSGTSPLRKIFTGGAPVFPHEAAIFCRAFPDANIQIVFGSTEAEPISEIAAHTLAASDCARGLCVGFPAKSTAVKILTILDAPMDADFFEKNELKTGNLGEICVAGEHVLDSYFGNETAFRENKIIDKNGRLWHRTGDSGWLDSDGQLWLTGRCKQLIFNELGMISPFILENKLSQLDGIEIGTAMKMADEKVVIFLEKKAGFDENSIKKSVENALDFLPDAVVFLKKIPRDPRHFSKIDYDALRRNK